MREHPLRRILSKIVAQDPEGWRLSYTHRGAPDDKVEVELSQVSKVSRGSFTLSDGETQIPFHRILAVTNSSGAVLWEKRPRVKSRLQSP